LRILLTGRNGQVGWELERKLARLGAVHATDRAALDLADFDAIRRVVREAKPEVIVNAAAHTAVDQAESEPAAAMRLNAEAPGVLAEEAKRLGAMLVHYSTDYVFDGTSQAPYVESDATNPLSVYGRSKLEGERAIEAVDGRHLILRTSWVYSGRGKNFFLTMLRLAKERPELRVVDDQRGAPTWARSISEATAAILPVAQGKGISGLFHFTAAGATTWFGFATEILRLAGLATRLTPIAAADYPTAARRPANSVLCNTKLQRDFGVALPEWRDALEVCAAEFIDVPAGRRAR
jgi:dTDP-4-dehydrorhamnose reductase